MITQSVAALTFCQRMHKSEMDGVCGADSTVGNQEDKFVVINAGHDDTHISVYKRNTDVGQLELLNATEGPWGGTFVDDQLYSMLSIIIGRSVHQMLVDFDRTDILDFQRKLKTKWMTTRTSHDQEKVRIVLYDCNFSSCIMKGILQATKPNKGTIFWAASKFGIKTETYETLFKPCIGEIVRHVKDILLQPNSVETNTYILVGELSESPIFQDAIKKALLNGKFIIPLNPSKAVCRGAVQFAHKPLSVTPTSPKHAESVKETLTHIFHCGINPFLFL
ncbi:heat shock 70 kDa protein 12A-like [Mercenaria mercenaria]|uniref:heat shock 70 kDa protein 12A-like n=1 Tax=Mercenaria mercenaria TaxID=6596 RepID=UPI00234E73E7|nr:heat shock 70 kDa protein 12A-like [Mercenaria mercenaria]